MLTDQRAVINAVVMLETMADNGASNSQLYGEAKRMFGVGENDAFDYFGHQVTPSNIRLFIERASGVLQERTRPGIRPDLNVAIRTRPALGPGSLNYHEEVILSGGEKDERRDVTTFNFGSSRDLIICAVGERPHLMISMSVEGSSVWAAAAREALRVYASVIERDQPEVAGKLRAIASIEEINADNGV